jgi:hypothetical protein
MNPHIQAISEYKLEGHIIMQNCKRVWISDNIWKSKLEGCRLEQLDGKTRCKRTTSLMGIIRGHT